MTKDDILENITFHSAIGIDYALEDNKKFYSYMKRTKKAMKMFVAAGEDLLIHKSSKALWKISEDGEFIEPVFEDDVIIKEDEI